MQVIGIIAEYNPFHLGHMYQIERLRDQYPAGCGIVAVMSGSFTQRGAPCILDKWMRARHAVVGGVDLVLELPFVFSCRSAQDFANGGVSLLSRLGIVSRLAFGIEAASLAPLIEMAARIDTVEVQQELRAHITAGCSYPAALSSALSVHCDVPPEILRTPNIILAVEYLRALRRLAPHILPIGIQRYGAEHGDKRLHRGITSASSIRRALYGDVPPWALLRENILPEILDSLRAAHLAGLPSPDRLLPLLHCLLLQTDTDTLRRIYGVSEGLENRLIRTLQTAYDYTSLLSYASAKRYPKNRIARLIIHLLLRLDKAQAASCDTDGARYIRPLAFNTRGREMLRAVKERAQLPIITRTADFLTSIQRLRPVQQLSPLQQMLSFDTRAAELRCLTLSAPSLQTQHTDFTASPHFLSFHDKEKG